MPGRANYLLGNDVRASYDLYGRVRWRDVYAGIDLVFRGNQEHLEYDFEIDAGRDPRRIKLSFDGVDQLQIDPNGDLVLQVGTVRIHQPKPVAYQVVAGQRQLVDVAYRIDTASRIGFRTGPYDRRLPLVIDPEIVFEQSFGGSGQSSVAGLVRDAQGGLYVAGATNSTDLATVNPIQGHLGTAPLLVTADAGKTWTFPSLGPARLVRAIAAAPSAPLVAYAATPVGVFASADGGTSWTATANTGLAGPATALSVDAKSATTLYAATAKGLFVSTDGAASWRLPANAIPGSGILAIAAHPSQTGTLFASNQNPPSFFRSTDFGQTWTQLSLASGNPPTVSAILVAPGSTIVAATYSGLFLSNDGGNNWIAGAGLSVAGALAIAITPANPSILYLANSSGLLRSSDGGQTFSVVLSVNFAQFGPIGVDPRNPDNVYAAATVYAGNVQETNFLYRSTDGGKNWTQVSQPFSAIPQSLFISPADSRVFLGAFTYNDAFITKWSPDGSQVLYSTYLGGSGDEATGGIAVDSAGSVYVTGRTSSPDFPTTLGAFRANLTGSGVFVSKLTPDGSQLSYSTLLGSGSAAGIAVDATGNAVVTGLTQGDFPVTANALQSVTKCTQSVYRKGDAFVARVAADGKSLVYSTLLGGSCPGVDVPVISPSTYGSAVKVDASGNAWVAGATFTPDFPVTSDALQPQFGGGLYDGFLARFSPTGRLDYATYLGGPGYDALTAIAFDRNANIYLTGESGGLSQPSSAGAFQPQASASCQAFTIGPSFPSPQGNALLLALDPGAHAVLRLTYLGAPLCLSPASIAVDTSGETWIAGPFDVNGSTPQTANPIALGIGKGFISKFSADFTRLLFSTYFNPVAGLALDSTGAAFVAGSRPANSASGTQAVYLAKIDATPSAISLDSVTGVVPPTNTGCRLSSCSPQPTAFAGIAPGEVIRLAGRKMGPSTPTPGVIAAGALATNVAGVQVTFDGVPVPLLSVSAEEIVLVAPFELASKSVTTVQVQYNGARSNPLQVAVTGTSLQVLGVFNPDFSLNSASSPAKAGSVMILYVSGGGQTNPPSPNGGVNAAPLAAPGAPVQVQWFANDLNNPTVLPVKFAAAAWGLAAGILQVNFVAPPQSLTNVNVIVGDAAAKFNVYVQP